MTEPTPQPFSIDDTLPDLYIPHPRCSHCMNDVQIEDDYARCETCLIKWDRVEEGRPADPDPDLDLDTEVPCDIRPRTTVDDSERQWTSSSGNTYTSPGKQPCILPSGHDGQHLHPTTWTPTQPDALAADEDGDDD